MNFLFIFALLVAGASAFVLPEKWPGAVNPWAPGYPDHVAIPHSALIKEWDQEDGSLKSIKVDEEYLKSVYPFYGYEKKEGKNKRSIYDQPHYIY